MRGPGLSFAVVVGSFAGGMAAVQAAELPPGLHRELIARECAACHDLDKVAATRRSSGDWIRLLSEMPHYGERIDPDVRTKILSYLLSALNLGPPVDQRVFEERMQKLLEEFRKKQQELQLRQGAAQ
jgi:hypothetical protein